MKKGIIITLIVVGTLIAGYYLYTWSGGGSCPPARDPKKFPEPWLENKIPHGDLGTLAEKYVNPVLGNDDTQTNGALIGGFFKGINVYPSDGAARYYQSYLKTYLKSSQAVPYWNMMVGELLCKTQE